MEVTTHPEELSRECINKWLDNFKKKLRRTTTRDDLDRLILSLDRFEFSEKVCGGWKDVNFKLSGLFTIILLNDKGEKCGNFNHCSTSFQKTILEKNPQLKRKIDRSELREEGGKWILEQFLEEKIISVGGEAIVLKEKFGELEVAVRVQVFDSALFTDNNEEFEFDIHLSKGINDFVSQ